MQGREAKVKKATTIASRLAVRNPFQQGGKGVRIDEEHGNRLKLLLQFVYFLPNRALGGVNYIKPLLG